MSNFAKPSITVGDLLEAGHYKNWLPWKLSASTLRTESSLGTKTSFHTSSDITHINPSTCWLKQGPLVQYISSYVLGR